MADYEVVGSPSNYGAPNVFQSNNQAPAQQQGQQQQQQGNPASALLAKAKDLLSRGLINSDQYNKIAGQYGQNAELTTMAGNMGQTMPGSAGAPLNILPGQGG